MTWYKLQNFSDRYNQSMTSLLYLPHGLPFNEELHHVFVVECGSYVEGRGHLIIQRVNPGVMLN